MKECCITSFALHGFATGFKLANEGEQYTCHICGAVYVLKDGTWGPRDEKTGTP